MTEWYVIDRRTNEIVNCITTDGPRVPSLERFTSAEFLYLDANPPMYMLQQYRYWNERP